MKEILIVVPVYNEEKNILKVIDKIITNVPQADILVVDDGSTDRTKEILDYHKVSYLSHAANLGYGSAVQTGLKYAVSNKYPIISLMDGDGQHDPKELFLMIKKLKEENLDLVIGSRFITFWKTVYPVSLPRKLGMIFFSLIASLLTKIRIKDTTSGFQVFNLRTAGFLQKIYPTDFPDAEILILLNLLYFKTKEIPVKMNARKKGKSMITFFRSLYYPFRMFVSILVVLIRVLILKKQVKNV
ncbi:MAG TPA: glycosyltransferase family 2 protein [Acidobacteriota bacterium]|nr:glycosyltransferase family 2 protein [Acidobacteriota bacterium]